MGRRVSNCLKQFFTSHGLVDFMKVSDLDPHILHPVAPRCFVILLLLFQQHLRSLMGAGAPKLPIFRGMLGQL